MIINLIKEKQMFSLSLPKKIKGQYWVKDKDEQGKERELISIEAVEGEWIAKSNKKVSITDSTGTLTETALLKPQSLLNLKIAEEDERVILFAEKNDESRQRFKKYVFRKQGVLYIGRTEENNVCYENSRVSGKHAKVMFDGEYCTILDTNSTNGIYVNGYKTASKKLEAGDYIYIMGLIIIAGSGFIAINNPDNQVRVQSELLGEYAAQKIEKQEQGAELPERNYFFRSPRFHREIEHCEIRIDPPPTPDKPDTVPLVLMIGPAMTMAMTSVTTACISVMNVISNNGEWLQAFPTILMAFSMLLGTIMWPILTKKHEKKEKARKEKKRQEQYLEYLDKVKDEIKRECSNQKNILVENAVSTEQCMERIAEGSEKLWERVIGQADFLRLRLGIGKLPMNADIKYQEQKFSLESDNLQNAMLALGMEEKILEDVPISVALTENRFFGIYGETAVCRNLLKQLVVQMITLHSYDELKIVLLVDKEDEEYWNFVRAIPHFWSNDRKIRFFSSSADEAKELSAFLEKELLERKDTGNQKYEQYIPYYVIVAACEQPEKKCNALKQLLKYENNCGFSVLFSARELRELPKETKSVVTVGEKQAKMFNREDTTGKETVFRVDRVNEAVADAISSEIATIELDMESQRYALPAMLTFLEMFHVSKVEHLNSLTRWKENNPTATLQTPVGVDIYGEAFQLDLHEKFHGPHGLVAGMTGSGKSEFIITYILSLAINYHPDEVAFILIDYKGGGLAGAFEDAERGIKLPHLAGTITNLDGAAVKRSLVSIQSELRRRQAIFNEARKISNEGTMNIYQYQKLYRDKVVTEPIPHLFIISDEFAELKTQQPEFMEQLISAARIGRSLGVHLILATQKPSGVVDDQIWSNSKFRVCLKVQEKSDSQDMIKCPDAAELSQTGRFYLQVGYNELFAMGQSAWCGADYIPTETVVKTVDNSIQVVNNLGSVMMSVKPNKKSEYRSQGKQIVTIVKYLSDLAGEENISVRPLWLPPIPERIFVADLEEKYGVADQGIVLNPVVGEYDDPFNQKQEILTVPLSAAGNCLVYGATGNGKTTFLTTLAYSMIKNHTAEEVNLYILDFSSGTLKMFEKAPQVGDVILASEEEKVGNLVKMLQQEMEKRRGMFAEFGGEYQSYCKNSGKTVPNLVILVNNFAAFTEQYEDLLEDIYLLTREGVKYGIYFVVTAGSTNAVRYKMQQNFSFILTMQLNDATDYAVVVGKTEGLIPSRHKGCGLVALDRVYEFQTAYCADAEDIQAFVRTYCQELTVNAISYAAPVPVLPKTVDFAYIQRYIDGLHNVPTGVDRKTLKVHRVNVQNQVIFPVTARDMEDMRGFAEGILKVLSAINAVTVVDSENLTEGTKLSNCSFVTEYEDLVLDLFADMVERNNCYKDAGLELSVLEPFAEKVYVFVGMKRFLDKLSEDAKDKFFLLLEKAESFYKIHFVFINSVAQWNLYNYEVWYKRHISGSEGIWIGDGVTEQYMLKINKITPEMYEEIGEDYGYLISRNRASQMKLLNCAKEE